MEQGVGVTGLHGVFEPKQHLQPGPVLEAPGLLRDPT